ncbi:MAG: hypothetical protein ABIU87_07015 [Ornithinibacter sp.]
MSVPATEPDDSGLLTLDDGARIWWEASGGSSRSTRLPLGPSM